MVFREYCRDSNLDYPVFSSAVFNSSVLEIFPNLSTFNFSERNYLHVEGLSYDAAFAMVVKDIENSIFRFIGIAFDIKNDIFDSLKPSEKENLNGEGSNDYDIPPSLFAIIDAPQDFASSKSDETVKSICKSIIDYVLESKSKSS